MTYRTNVINISLTFNIIIQDQHKKYRLRIQKSFTSYYKEEASIFSWRAIERVTAYKDDSHTTARCECVILVGRHTLYCFISSEGICNIQISLENPYSIIIFRPIKSCFPQKIFLSRQTLRKNSALFCIRKHTVDPPSRPNPHYNRYLQLKFMKSPFDYNVESYKMSKSKYCVWKIKRLLRSLTLLRSIVIVHNFAVNQDVV